MAEGFENRDRLLRFIGNSEFAQDLLARIEEDGYAVLPDVFSQEEADREYDRMWSWMETVCPGIKRRSPASWRRQGGFDPWPSKQRDMMQLHQAGWVFSDLRQIFGERVFEKLYDTQELHCSKDGFTLQRPTDRELNKSPNDHFDQSSKKYGLQCIQGSVALTDQEHDDGCFLCWPGSHKHHRHITSDRRKGGRQDFIILDDAEKAYLESQGIEPLRVPVKKGTVILWRSDLVHKGAPPIGRRVNFRGVVYVCMMPAALTPEDVYAQKRQAYAQLLTSSHWPCFEEWFSPGRSDRERGDLKPFFRQPPSLTPRQRLLYGLDRYPAAPGPAGALHAVMNEQSKQQSDKQRGDKDRCSTNKDIAACADTTQQRKSRRWGRAALPVDEEGSKEIKAAEHARFPQIMLNPSANQTVSASPEGVERSFEVHDPKVAECSRTAWIEKEVRKVQKSLREISALEDAVASGQALLKNQMWKLDKKPVLQQRLSELGVLDKKDPA